MREREHEHMKMNQKGSEGLEEELEGRFDQNMIYAHMKFLIKYINLLKYEFFIFINYKPTNII